MARSRLTRPSPKHQVATAPLDREDADAWGRELHVSVRRREAGVGVVSGGGVDRDHLGVRGSARALSPVFPAAAMSSTPLASACWTAAWSAVEAPAKSGRRMMSAPWSASQEMQLATPALVPVADGPCKALQMARSMPGATPAIPLPFPASRPGA